MEKKKSRDPGFDQVECSVVKHERKKGCITRCFRRTQSRTADEKKLPVLGGKKTG